MLKTGKQSLACYQKKIELKILLTGSSGFIGGWFLDAMLHANDEVYGVDIRPKNSFNKMTKFFQTDIRDYSAMKKVFEEVQPDILVHMAARTDLEGKTLDDYDSNTVGTEVLCQLVAETASVNRAIYTSSMLVCKVGYIPTSETDYCPHTVYGESKVKTEEIVRKLDGGGKTWCLVRPTTAWGPRMSLHYQTLLRLIKGRKYFHSGSGELYKSYVYVENIVHQFIKLMEVDKDLLHREVFYLADYNPISLRGYTNMLAEKLNTKSIPTLPLSLVKFMASGGDILERIGFKTIPFNSFRLSNILTEYIFDLSKTENVCGPLPYSFEQGVEKTAAWYLNKEKNN
jgi:nucleoside-diphosphate-sugar epimerase